MHECIDISCRFIALYISVCSSRNTQLAIAELYKTFKLMHPAAMWPQHFAASGARQVVAIGISCLLIINDCIFIIGVDGLRGRNANVDSRM